MAAGAAIWACGSATPSFAQCLPIAGVGSELVPAAFQPAMLAAGTVRLSFLGHSSFWIETAGRIARRIGQVESESRIYASEIRSARGVLPYS
jgi:hypothetical protein